jgi:uncharacterized phage-like protein YoqJ
VKGWLTVRVAITGHRSEDCISEQDVRIKGRVKLQYPTRTGAKVTGVICGLANGTDLWLADEARLLGLEVWAAKPWAGHKPRGADKELYDTIITYASRVVNVDESQNFPGKQVYQKRNEWMVDNADVVMAYWSGSTSGGTYNCVQYAKKVGKPLANIYFDPPF